MNKLYAAPLAALGLFALVYAGYHRGFEARMAEFHRRIAADQVAKRVNDQIARTRAVEIAIEAREKRQRERQEEEEGKRARAATLRALEEELALSRDDEKKLQTRLDRAQADVQLQAERLTRAEERRKELRAEEEFLEECVKAAAANRESFLNLLAKFEAAEKARQPQPGNRHPTSDRNSY